MTRLLPAIDRPGCWPPALGPRPRPGRSRSGAASSTRTTPGSPSSAGPRSTGQLRGGPQRRVVDLVCLVPDLPTFLEAIAPGTRTHYFPILIDDVELDLKFLRAFRPARIVRYRGQGPADRARRRRGTAPSRPSATPGRPRAPRPTPGSRATPPPDRLGQTPAGRRRRPPDSPTLAGPGRAGRRAVPAVDPARHARRRQRSELTEAEIGAVPRRPRRPLGAKLPSYARLGDDCDFLTLAGDYPYRYQSPKGPLRRRRPRRPRRRRASAGPSRAGCSATPGGASTRRCAASSSAPDVGRALRQLLGDRPSPGRSGPSARRPSGWRRSADVADRGRAAGRRSRPGTSSSTRPTGSAWS